MAEYVIDRGYYYPGIVVTKIINAIIGIIEFMLALRLVLELLSASSSSTFVAWMYGVTSGLVTPFTGAFPALSLAGFPIDFAVILAMIGYAIIGWLIIRLLAFIFVSLESI